jgi:hypothetical protein
MTRARIAGAIFLVAAVVAIAQFVWDIFGDIFGDGNGAGRPTESTQPLRVEPTGQIVSPASGDRIQRDIEVRGILANIPVDQHVWLVVRDGNLLYPQDAEVTPSDGEWSLGFHQGGAAKKISLELYRMSDTGHRFITTHQAAGTFSGISRIPGATRLDVVENLRIRGLDPIVRSPKPTGQILSPASGDRVPRDIEARGTLAHIREGQHVWVVVRDGNLLYPQGSEVTPSDGEWSLAFHQGGVTNVISVELYLMGTKGHQFIIQRLDAGDFSGISRIPGATRLDVAVNLRVQN